ncbi:MAG: LysR substrate-binding domain-containing protein [Opitutaceae bacterium]|jgi:DNA-binding transcriptional LysR family regulator
MELRHLRYFVAVAEELNFRKASERLRVAQPALSRQIQDLEADVGAKLLNRNTSCVRLTDAGAAFLVECRLILSQSQHAIGVARDAAKGLRGRIKVGYLAPLLTGFIPPALSAFGLEYPNVDISMLELSNPEQLVALDSGAIQVGFGVKETAAPLPRTLDSKVIGRTPFMAVMGKRHRLAKMHKVTLAELAREPLLAMALTKGAAPHVDAMRRLLMKRGIKAPQIRSIEGAETFLATLEGGLGVSLMGATGSLSRGKGLVFKALEETGDDLMIELRVVWRKGDASNLVSNFIDILVAANGLAKSRL